MIPGIGGAATLSGGAGGVDLSGGPSSAEGDASGYAGGQSFNFVPPQSVQLANNLQTPLIIGAAVVALWLFTRNK